MSQLWDRMALFHKQYEHLKGPRFRKGSALPGRHLNAVAICSVRPDPGLRLCTAGLRARAEGRLADLAGAGLPGRAAGLAPRLCASRPSREGLPARGCPGARSACRPCCCVSRVRPRPGCPGRVCAVSPPADLRSNPPCSQVCRSLN